MASIPESGWPTWTESAMQACRVGDIKTLEDLLSQQNEPHPENDDDFIATLMSVATGANQAQTLTYLLARYPMFPKKKWTLSQVHVSIFTCKAGLSMYKILVEHYPFLKQWDFGELGDYLGSAAMRNDLEFATYLLNHEGADATRARFMHIPILRWLRDKKDSDAMIKLLKDHGAVDE